MLFLSGKNPIQFAFAVLAIMDKQNLLHWIEIQVIKEERVGRKNKGKGDRKQEEKGRKRSQPGSSSAGPRVQSSGGKKIIGGGFSS